LGIVQRLVNVAGEDFLRTAAIIRSSLVNNLARSFTSS